MPDDDPRQIRDDSGGRLAGPLKWAGTSTPSSTLDSPSGPQSTPGQLFPASTLHPSHELPHHDPDHKGRANRYQGLVSDQTRNLSCGVLNLVRSVASDLA